MTRRDALPQRAARARGARRVPRGAPDQGQRRRACAASPSTSCCRSRGSRASTPTRCASSSSCRSTPTTPGRPEQVLTGDEIRAAIHALYPLEPEPREPHATARVYRFADGQGRIGFINPVSEPFCGDCNRIRLTADGKLRTCLFCLNETDLRGPMRAGATDDDLEAIIRDAVWRKELKHHVNEPGFVQPERSMCAIGG